MNKKYLIILAVILVLFFVIAGVLFRKKETPTGETKPGADRIATQSVAIVYHPYNDGIKQVARIIESRVGGDVYLLEPFSDYPMSADLKKDRIIDEQNHPEKVQLKNNNFDYKKYNVIFIGAPVIYNNLSPLVMRFAMDYTDLLKSDKVVIPFVFYNEPDSAKEAYIFMYKYLSKAAYKGGFTTHLLDKSAVEMYVDLWLSDIKFNKSELKRPDRAKAKAYKQAIAKKDKKLKKDKDIEKAIRKNRSRTGKKGVNKPKYKGYGD